MCCSCLHLNSTEQLSLHMDTSPSVEGPAKSIMLTQEFMICFYRDEATDKILQERCSLSFSHPHHSLGAGSVRAGMSVVQTGEGVISGSLQIPDRLPDFLPPPQWTPRGGQGSWPGPGLWVHPGRMCLKIRMQKSKCQSHETYRVWGVNPSNLSLICVKWNKTSIKFLAFWVWFEQHHTATTDIINPCKESILSWKFYCLYHEFVHVSDLMCVFIFQEC